MSLRTLLGARAPLLVEGPRRRGCSSSTASSSTPRTHLDDLGSDSSGSTRRSRGRGARGRPARGSRDEAEAAVRARRRAAAPDRRAMRAGERAPIPMLLAVGAVHHRLVAAGLAHARRRSSSTATSRARRTTSPACSATAPRRSARGSRSRRSRRWPRRTSSAATGPRPPRRSAASARRSRTACSRSCPRWASPTSRAYCGAQIFDASGSPTRWSSSASPERRRRVGGIGLRRARARGARPARGLAGRGARAREPRLRQVPQGRRAARDQPGRRRRAAGRRPRRTRCARPSTVRRWARYERFADARQRPPADRAARPARARAGRAAGAARRGRAGRVEIVRRFSSGGMSHGVALGRGARDDRDRVQQARRPLELRRGRRGPGPLPHRAQLADQAGRLRPLRRHPRVRGARRRAADQDRAGLEARRGRPAARPQGHGRDRAAPAHAARRRADLAAAAPRHLLDRGPRAADLRPAPGEPGRGGLGEARRRGGRRARRRRRA